MPDPIEPAAMEPLRIHRLEVRNYKKIKHAVITPDPDQHVLLLTGKNRQGKTSLIETIWVCLCGEKYLPPKAIRDGEDSAEASIDFGEFVVTRTITPKTTRLSVVAKDGFKAPSPQTFLTSKISDMIQNPLDYMRLKPDQQLKHLQGLVNLQVNLQEWEKRTGLPLKKAPDDPLALFDQAHKYLYDERGKVNQEVTRLTGAVRQLAMEIPDEHKGTTAVSVSGLFNVRRTLEEKKKANDHARGELIALLALMEDLEKQTQAVQDEIEASEAEIERLRKVIEKKREQRTNMIVGLKEKREAADEMKTAIDQLVDPDFSEVDAKIQGADAINRMAAKVEEHAKLSAELVAARAKSEAYTRGLAGLKEYKGDLIAQAGLPVAGLSFEGGVVTYNGFPLSQASGAEQIQVSCAICMASHPRIGLLTLDTGWADLDKGSQAVLTDWAKTMGANIVVVQVSEEPQEAGWHFEDGEITHLNGQPVPKEEAAAPVKRGRKKKSEADPDGGETIAEFDTPSWVNDWVETPVTPETEVKRPRRLTVPKDAVEGGGA